MALEPEQPALDDGPSPELVDFTRRFSTADTDLEDYRRVRRAHGGTVNDVVLATVTGALARWLHERGTSTP